MKYITLLLLLLLLTSCGTIYTAHDYDEKQDFLIYKSYDFYPEMDSGLNDLDQKRLLKEIEIAMQNKGLVKSETPDIFINFKTAITKKASRNSIGVGVGSGGGGIGIGVGGSIPIGGPETYLELTTDFIDVKRNELVWQAIAEKRFRSNASPDVHSAFFQKIIEKSLSEYPPKKKK